MIKDHAGDPCRPWKPNECAALQPVEKRLESTRRIRSPAKGYPDGVRPLVHAGRDGSYHAAPPDNSRFRLLP
jgi:hypothetical protein